MFYDIFISLCNEKGVKPSPLLSSLGLSKSNSKNWQEGKVPDTKAVIALSEYFGVTTDYLLFGKKNEISEIETKLLDRFRQLDELEKEVILGKVSEMILKKEEETETSFEISDDISPCTDIHKLGVNKR